MRVNAFFRGLTLAAVCLGALGASVATAAAPTGEYARFKGCPYANPLVLSCVLSISTGGSFQLGTTTVPITPATPLIFQGGFAEDPDAPGKTIWFNAARGFQTLSPTHLKIPGGLAGVLDPDQLSGGLAKQFEAAVSSSNDVYETAELVGPVHFDYLNAAASLDDPLAILPVRLHLENPFLGPNCFIGSAAHPVILSVTDGTTHPPPGVPPLVGSLGVLSTTQDSTVSRTVGTRMVDNTLMVPAATNCGFMPQDRLAVTADINRSRGLPAAPGESSAILTGESYLGSPPAIRQSIP